MQLQDMVEEVFTVDMWESTVRGIWKSPEQGEEVASRLDLAMGRGWGKQGRER